MFRVGMACVAAIGLVLCACSEKQADQRTVVLYTSADEHLASEVVEAFEAQTGIRVRVLGDTEQTKTTGLVQRLLSEVDHPRADVWWSSEALGTVKLSRAGVLGPYEARAVIDGGWPEGLRGRGGDWYGFAQRARVIAYNTDRVSAQDVPRTLRALTGARWRGRVGMARPQFGTTRSHMAAIAAAHGEEALGRWLSAMKENGLRIYDGNSTAVAALARGEIDVCLTDTDDVWAAQRNGWPVDLVYEQVDGPGEPVEGLGSLGALVMPNTVALVAGGPHREEAGRLIEFLLSERVESLIALSDSHNVPVRASLAEGLGAYAIESPWIVRAEVIADHAAGAIEVCTTILGR
jgi:iron(III) transport system substrate-binding protein